MNSLRNQILLLCISVVSATAICILIAFLITTDKYIHQQVTMSVSNAANAFNQLLEARENQLISSAKILTSDFGFKQSVATKDAATITSVLENHGERIKADLMLLTDLDGKLLASSIELTHSTPGDQLRLMNNKTELDGTATFALIGDEVYQIILLPVKAPIPIAYAAAGFIMDGRLAKDLSQLSGLDVTFVVTEKASETPLVSTLNKEQISLALSSESVINPTLRLPFLEKAHYRSQKITLEDSPALTFGVVLSASLDRAYEEFDQLRDNILIIAVLILLLSAAGSFVLSKSLAGPLNKLVGIVGEYSRGNYKKEEADVGTKELKTLFSAFSSMGERIQAREKQITYQAQHDSLTGLLNRNTLLTSLQAMMNNQTPFLLIAINIKGLRSINDTFGQAIGDQVLVSTANRLTKFCIDDGTCARLGGDEFLVAFRLDKVNDCQEVAELLIENLCLPLCIEEVDLTLGFKLGLAIYPEHANTPEQLLRRVSIALDSARAEHLPLKFYETGSDAIHLQRLRMVNDLKTALKKNDGQLFMVYQPKLNLATGKVDKLESLIRWMHPNEGFIPPDLFIELAEQSGLIIEVTNWVLKQVISQTSQWFVSGYPIQSAINISAQDLEREELLDLVEQCLEETNLPHHALCFELTERDMMQDADRAVKLMQNFKDKGFGLSVDDYGIGQSSLSKLKQMPVNEIKIDKSFVLNLDKSESDQIIVQSTIELGHRFKLKVIAEGVETKASLDMLREMGCDYIQGYFLSKPIAADTVDQWLDDFQLAPLAQEITQSNSKSTTSKTA